MPFAPTKNRTKVTCPSCNTSYTLTDREDEIPTIQCASIGCPVLLCPCCPQFECAGCGQRHCMEHAIEEKEQQFPCTCIRLDVDVYDDSDCWSCNSSIRPKPLKFCPPCMEEVERIDWPVEIPRLQPVTATVAVPNVPEWVA